MADLATRTGLRAFISPYYKTNHRIQAGCAGISTIVYVAWQFGLRDGSSTLADPAMWRGLDARLPYKAWTRVHAFLEENFLLGVGDDKETPWTLITSCFSHMRTNHFLSNIFAFNSLFNFLGRVVPPVHMIGLMIGSGLGGSAGFLAQQSRSKFRSRRTRALGMSGITTGLGVASAVLYPSGGVSVYGFPVPTWLALGGYLAWDIFLLPSETSNIGHAAHIGGGIAGFLYASSLRFLGGTYTRPGQGLLSR